MGSLPDLDNPWRISTVVPATPRKDPNAAFQLNTMDLLVKLHYIRLVFLFDSLAAGGLSIYELKKQMFPLLDPYAHVSGRIRRSESGRPFIKCNDAGVRIAESRCDRTLREWINDNRNGVVEGLVHDHVLGPDLAFSPLVFVKFTWFKCGGLSVGLSWAHLLGDAFSAFNFISKWSQLLGGQALPKSLHMPNLPEPQISPNSISEDPPISIQGANIVGEYWLPAKDKDLATHSFHITSEQLHHLVMVTSNQISDTTKKTSSYFDFVSALLWKCIANIRDQNSGPKVVTICTSKTNRPENEFPTNDFLVFSKIESDFWVGKREISELVKLIAENKVVENPVIEKMVENDEGKEDYIVYGAKLTFVDLEEANAYDGVRLNGQKPIMANCAFHGVGDQGVVLVLPSPEDNDLDGGNGRIVTVSLPRDELDQLKDKLGGEWGIH